MGLTERAAHHRMSSRAASSSAWRCHRAREPPQVLLADEPTGELDSESAEELFSSLRAINEALGVTVIVLTHDPLVSTQVNRTIAIRDGRTSTETLRRAEFDESGEHRIIAEEFALLDRVGRLQLPREYVETLELERASDSRSSETMWACGPTASGNGAPKRRDGR